MCCSCLQNNRSTSECMVQRMRSVSSFQYMASCPIFCLFLMRHPIKRLALLPPYRLTIIYFLLGQTARIVSTRSVVRLPECEQNAQYTPLVMFRRTSASSLSYNRYSAFWPPVEPLRATPVAALP